MATTTLAEQTVRITVLFPWIALALAADQWKKENS